MRNHPRILRVEAGALSLLDMEDESVTPLRDVAASTAPWERRIERLMRLNIAAAIYAKQAEEQCDIVWAASESVGIPLSFVRLHKPLVVIPHHMSSPVVAKFARATGAVNKWAGIGFISDEGREFLINYFGVNPNRLFQCESAKYLGLYDPAAAGCDGPIMSTGVVKRDYGALLAALAGLPECSAELFISSRYGDKLKKALDAPIPERVKTIGWVSEEELIRRYHRARFVAVPLEDTTHPSAGMTGVLEASALGKAVIATATGGMRTFVKDGETGILVPPYDVEAWKRAIHRLWTQPELADQMGQAGRRYMQSRFDKQAVDANINVFLDDLYKGRLSTAATGAQGAGANVTAS